jgi:hypothetical protein
MGSVNVVYVAQHLAQPLSLREPSNYRNPKYEEGSIPRYCCIKPISGTNFVEI